LRLTIAAEAPLPVATVGQGPLIKA